MNRLTWKMQKLLPLMTKWMIKKVVQVMLKRITSMSKKDIKYMWQFKNSLKRMYQLKCTTLLSLTS